jgi:hypothetical protein
VEPLRVRLDFSTKQLEMNGNVLGRFLPRSATEGTVELGAARYSYLIRPKAYGERITLYGTAGPVVVRETNYHDGVYDLRVGDSATYDLHNEILFNSDGPAGQVAFTAKDLTMEFNSRLPANCLDIVAAVVALDTMWANLVGFTRTRVQPAPRRSPG